MIRHAARSLARSPGFTATAILTLALGIGATTAIFSVVDTAMLRPLPFPAPERVVRVWETNPAGQDFVASDPNYLNFRDRNRSFETLAAIKPAPLSLTGAGEPRRLDGRAVTHDLFPLLGARPALGRTFLPEEDVAGGETRVALLSHSLWREQFGGDPGVVGETITLDRQPYTVIGVMPADFGFPTADLWVPLAPNAAGDRDDHWLEMVGRLRPGVDVESAARDLGAIARAIGEQDPTVPSWGVRVEPFSSWLVGPRFRRTMLVLLGGVGCLLLIGCLNLANLLLARATARETEIGIRAALGAGRGRIVRQLLTESLLLATIGAMIGVLGAAWAIDVLRSLSPAGVPRLDEIAIDGRAVAFALLLAVGTTLIFGAAPAMRASRVDLARTLRGARAPARGQRRMRDALVVAQVALASVLLVSAGLLMRGFMQLQSADPGFDAAELATISLQLDASGYAEEWRRVRFMDQVLERIEAVPGVRAAGATGVEPFSGWNLVNDVTPSERAAEVGASGYLQAGWRAVTPGFFRAMGIPVLSGRTFAAGDAGDGPPLAVISATLAQRLWPDEEAVGKRLYWGGVDGEPRTVIGVVGDYRDVELDGEATPVLFLPNNQIGWPLMTIVVRSEGDPQTTTAAVRAQIQAVDPLLPVPTARPLEGTLATVLAGPRFRSLLLGAFAVIALVLAAVGVYGVTAFAVARRTREFGVRMALGATPAELSRLALRGGAALALVGLALGAAGAWWLSRFLDTLLYGVTPTDPATFVAVALLLGGVTVVASYLPGRRAGRVDPVVALREE